MFAPRPVDQAIPAWRVAARQRHLDLTSPLRLAHKLLAAASDVRVVDGELVLTEAGKPPVRITVAGDGTIEKVSLIEDHSPRGDSLVEIHFGRYAVAGAVRLPYDVEITVDGIVVQQETRFRIVVDSAAADFVVPEAGLAADAEQLAYAQQSTEWIMTYVLSGVRFYFDLQTAPVEPKAVDVAEGVKVVLGPSHNILVVEMPDYVVAVDAPLYARYTSAALAQVRDAFPGKPLRYVVGTHFHYDHIGGIREFVAEGNVIVIAGDSSVPFFEEILRSDHSIEPDRLQTSPVATTVQGVTDKLVLPTADGGTLEIHRIETDHSDDTLIAYVSGPKLIFESDLWNATPTRPEPFSYRGRLAVQLCDAITARGLDVETVVSGHNGSDGVTSTHVAPYSYLQRTAGQL
jgi:glyoxylase-like metal-dependent hydrolase (beta-lactamase superfamily II)